MGHYQGQTPGLNGPGYNAGPPQGSLIGSIGKMVIAAAVLVGGAYLLGMGAEHFLGESTGTLGKIGEFGGTVKDSIGTFFSDGGTLAGWMENIPGIGDAGMLEGATAKNVALGGVGLLGAYGAYESFSQAKQTSHVDRLRAQRQAELMRAQGMGYA